MRCCRSEFGGRDSAVPDSPIADALLALKHAVVHTRHNNWMSSDVGQLSYTSHCQSPTLVTSCVQSTIFSASPMYARSSPTHTPFLFTSHHQQPHHQHHRYHSNDSQDSGSPALNSSSSVYPGGMHRPAYRRDVRDFTFGSSFAHDSAGLAFIRLENWLMLFTITA